MYSVVLMMALSSGAQMPADCSGCDGGGCSGGCHGGLFHRNGCHGGGHGGCHGGLFHRNRCHGCHGDCTGGCTGAPVVVGCCGGGCTGAPVVVGCTGAGCCRGAAVHPPAAMPKQPESVPAPKPAPEMKKETALPAPAIIVVSLPAEAKLLVDDAATTSTSGRRVFASPALEPGKDFYYTLKGEWLHDGSLLTATQRVRVRAGQETQVQLEFPVASVARR